MSIGDADADAGPEARPLMRAVRAVGQDPADPLAGLEVQRIPPPTPPPGWRLVRVVAAALNLHDVWTLRGVGHPADRIPITLGCDGAGYDEQGRPVVIHPVLGDAERGGGDLTLDPGRSLLSESVDGTLADYVAVPAARLLPKPDWLSFEQAAAIPVAWGTAYRMLYTRGGLQPGQSVLVQGATGGVAGAAISLAIAGGATVVATSRSRAGREFAARIGAHEVLEPGARVSERVDLVIETVGEASWAHSLRAVRRGGTIVVAGATTGGDPPADLGRVFSQQLRVLGSTAFTPDELRRTLAVMGRHRIAPHVDSVHPVERVAQALRKLHEGRQLGKIVIAFGQDRPPAAPATLGG